MQSEEIEPRSLVKRILSSSVNALLVPLLAVVTAVVIGAIVILVVGGNPFAAYMGLVQGAFGSQKALSETAVWATPYIFAGLAVAVAFKGGLFNIGAEGQLALGAVVSSVIGFALPGWINYLALRWFGVEMDVSLSIWIHLPLAVILGSLAGALWAAIPGFLKAYAGGHEVINTIMMNYIALNLTSFLMNGPIRDPSPTNVIARTPPIADSARFTPLIEGLRIHWGFVLGLLMAVVIWVVLQKTTFGYEVRMVGLNPDAAKYAGINVKRTIVLTMALSGLLAGLAGAIEVTALNFRHELGFSMGYGFDSIAVALLGKTNPFGVVIAAILFGAMKNGATRMQFLTMIPVDVISIIQALILLFVAADAIIRYIYRIKARGERVTLTRGWGG